MLRLCMHACRGDRGPLQGRARAHRHADLNVGDGVAALTPCGTDSPSPNLPALPRPDGSFVGLKCLLDHHAEALQADGEGGDRLPARGAA